MPISFRLGSLISMPSDSGRRVVWFVFAHPDDEFAVFPWIEDALRAGAQVHAAWLTDGGWGGQSIERRQSESERVLTSLGMPANHLHFLGARLGIADGDLHLSLERAQAALRELAERTGTTELMAPAWEGGHQDHDAAHLAVCAVAKATGARAWEYSLYHGEGLAGPFFKVLSLTARADATEAIPTTLRQRASYVFRCLSYRSQIKSFIGLLPLYAWQLRRATAFRRRPVRFEATRERPHPGRLLYERRTGLSWDDFAAATAAFRRGAGQDERSAVDP